MYESLIDKTKTQLVQIGSELGLELSERTKKEDLILTIQSSMKPEVKPSNLSDDKKNYNKHAKFAKFKKEGI